ncbi:sugar phosphate isomerase/epimerase [Pontibacter sp. 172403-2]|uniref:sugar phosphate isomerase/epimerase family protein n=1 Tax=Pontibacter rufus TaxID=2791028 RepID=UPI0018AFAAD6|nr:sugar phosphate isomerase/epimerase family protein [Pontibacter sp. 172403-2]MBF9254612.1 sugar phosphate isomerase/epimerase [Pontibacter sp. 172403-2]
MQFGASTFIWVSPFNTDSFNLVHKVKEMGYDILEIAVEDKDLINWGKLKEVVKDADLKVTISGAFGPERDISSDDPRIRAQGLKYITDCIRIAEDMESPVFGGPVYSAVGKTRIVSAEQKKQERDWCVENLIKAGKIAEDCGVVVGVEPLNRFETDMVNTADQAISLVKEVANPNIKILLDTFHCNIEEKNIPDTIRKVGKDLLCHIQGNESDRGTPGTGHLDWTGINEALTEIGYEGAIVIETFGAPSKELARAACIWRPLANSPDELAIDGLAFYKKQFAR